MSDQAKMLNTAWRINDDEVVPACLFNLFELPYEMFQVSGVARRIIVDVVMFWHTANFRELRHEQLIRATRVAVIDLLGDRIVIRQLQLELVFLIPFTSVIEVPRKG